MALKITYDANGDPLTISGSASPRELIRQARADCHAEMRQWIEEERALFGHGKLSGSVLDRLLARIGEGK